MRAGLKGVDMSKVKKVAMYVHDLSRILVAALDDVDVGPRPESMGAICAIVYLLITIVFIPLPFYEDIIASTSSGGFQEADLERQRVETGRMLHRFPHSKVKPKPNLPILV